MIARKIKWVLLLAGLFALFVFGVIALTKIDPTNPEWTEDIKLDKSSKERVIELIDRISSRYSLQKEVVESPSKLEGRPVHFYHYKIEENVVMTIHDLKGGGDTLTVYFYGLEGDFDKTFSSDIKSLLDSANVN